MKNILIVEAGGIGDMVLAEPSLAALKRAFPGANLTVLGVPRALPVLEHCPYVNQVIPLDQQILLSGPLANRLPYLFKSLLAIARLRKERFDAALNLYQLYSSRGAQRMRLLFRLIRAKETYGRNTAERGRFYTKSVPDPASPGSVHEVEMNLRVVRLLGIDAPRAHPKFWLHRSDREAAAQLLPRSWRNAGDPIVAICPGAETPNKRWRAERYATVALELMRRFNARILVLGGKADSALVPRLAPIFKFEGISLIGRTSLAQLAGILEQCVLLITNDSGPMHIAASVGTAIVAIFGPGYPGRFGPVGEGHQVLQGRVPCSPCDDLDCRQMRCLDLVSTDEVVALASEFLDARSTDRRVPG